MRKYNVGIIGCGAISKNHIKAILSAGLDLCALCDVLPEKAEQAIEKHSLAGARVYTDYREMLDQEKPYAVHVCTPHHLHAEMCIAALERNVHVLCEKPLCISLDQLESVRSAAEKSKAQLGVCHQNRYEPNMLRLYEMTRNGVRGGVGNVAWKRDEAYYNSAPWRGTWRCEGGGVMINQALHTLDIMQWVCGMPKYVTAHTATDHLASVMETEDTAMARFTCEDGTVFHHILSRDGLPGVEVITGDFVGHHALEPEGAANGADLNLREHEAGIIRGDDNITDGGEGEAHAQQQNQNAAGVAH